MMWGCWRRTTAEPDVFMDLYSLPLRRWRLGSANTARTRVQSTSSSSAIIIDDGREGALPHLGVRHADGDVAFGVDGEPGVDLGALRRRGPGLGLDGGGERLGNVEADEQAAAGSGGDFQEVAAGDGDGAHAARPSSAIRAAAVWMALRMRRYVPQRQRLPAMAASMSASVGLGFSARSAAADMIWPDWQ